jgi:hypothetical protein
MELKGHTNYIEALVALEKGLIASGSKDKTVCVWRTSDGTNQRTFPTPHPVSCLCYLGDSLLAVGMEETHHVMILNVESGTHTLINNAAVDRRIDGVFSISLTGQPDHIAIVCEINFHGMIRILNFRTGAVVQTLDGEFGDGYTVCAIKPNSIVFNSPRDQRGFGVITHTAGAYSAPVYKGDVQWTIMIPFDTNLMLGWCHNRVDRSFLNKVFVINIKTGVATLFYEIDEHQSVDDICKLGNHHIAVSCPVGIHIVKIKHTNGGAFKGERVVSYYTPIGVGGDLCAVEGGGVAITNSRGIEIYKTRYENTTRRQALRSILSRTNPNVTGHILSFLEGKSPPTKSKKPAVVYEPSVPHNSSGEFDYVAGAKRFAERTKQAAEKALHEKRSEERSKRLGKRGITLRTIEENTSFPNNAPPVISKINEIDLNLNRRGVPIDRKKYVQRHTFKRLSESLRQSRKRIFNSFASKLGVNELTESQKKLVENKMDNAFNRDVKVKSKNIVKLLTEPKPEPVAPVPKSKSRSKAAFAKAAAESAELLALLASFNEPD